MTIFRITKRLTSQERRRLKAHAWHGEHLDTVHEHGYYHYAKNDFASVFHDDFGCDENVSDSGLSAKEWEADLTHESAKYAMHVANVLFTYDVLYFGTNDVEPHTNRVQ